MNKAAITEQILQVMAIAENGRERLDTPYLAVNRELLNRNLEDIAKAFSGSWLGYHSRVYYRGFRQPQPGDSFSPEWGLMDPFGSHGDTNWVEVTENMIRLRAFEGVDGDYEVRLEEMAGELKALWKEALQRLSAIVAVLFEANKTKILKEISRETAEQSKRITEIDFIKSLVPKGTSLTRDQTAVSQGNQTPPHVGIIAWHYSRLTVKASFEELVSTASKLFKYLEMSDLIERPVGAIGSRVFIGHGQEPLWRELQDFIQNRLKLEWDEFNRESAAGLATSERLGRMLDDACVAFLVMTAEDRHSDERLHARENVIHEVGLFQGRLGFRRAIILLEEGCAEFSNIQGLSQIRFPKGNIQDAFEEIRAVLEREGIIRQR